MKNEVLISLCIPTNGITKWVKSVLESIYAQEAPDNLFEVVVTCNDNNDEFDKFMKMQADVHSNIIYQKTVSQGFDNQIDAFKLANGRFIRFINHRMKMKKGTITNLIDYVKENSVEKPITFFSNGSIISNEDVELINNFDTFINKLSIYSSWSSGFSCWKEDFDTLIKKVEINTLFPHCPFLFGIREGRAYCIDNRVVMEEVENDETKKGHYDLFYAFAVDFLRLVLDLYINKDITYNTFNKIKEDSAVFVDRQHKIYVVKKRPCSYDLSSFKKSVSIFYGSQINLKYIVLKKRLKNYNNRG